MREFFGCYLLKSLHPDAKGRTYIGFTVNPRRRYRQHNGMLVNGAWRTKKYRPWDMTLVVYGFPTQVHALQFEWAWQHPAKSKAVRPVAERLGSRGMCGLKGKIRLMQEMLHLSPWRMFPLTLQFLSSEYAAIKTGGPAAPEHIRVFTAPMEALPDALHDDDDKGDEPGAEGAGSGRETEDEQQASDQLGLSSAIASRQHGESSSSDGEGADTSGQPDSAAKGQAFCILCESGIERHVMACGCGLQFHVDCLAGNFQAQDPGCTGPPSKGRCPGCGQLLQWHALLASMQSYACPPPKRRERRKRAPAAAAKGGRGRGRGRGVVSAPTAAMESSNTLVEDAAGLDACLSQAAAASDNNAAAPQAGKQRKPAAGPSAGRGRRGRGRGRGQAETDSGLSTAPAVHPTVHSAVHPEPCNAKRGGRGRKGRPPAAPEPAGSADPARCPAAACGQTTAGVCAATNADSGSDSGIAGWYQPGCTGEPGPSGTAASNTYVSRIGLFRAHATCPGETDSNNDGEKDATLGRAMLSPEVVMLVSSSDSDGCLARHTEAREPPQGPGAWGRVLEARDSPQGTGGQFVQRMLGAGAWPAQRWADQLASEGEEQDWDIPSPQLAAAHVSAAAGEGDGLYSDSPPIRPLCARSRQPPPGGTADSAAADGSLAVRLEAVRVSSTPGARQQVRPRYNQPEACRCDVYDDEDAPASPDKSDDRSNVAAGTRVKGQPPSHRSPRRAGEELGASCDVDGSAETLLVLDTWESPSKRLKPGLHRTAAAGIAAPAAAPSVRPAATLSLLERVRLKGMMKGTASQPQPAAQAGCADVLPYAPLPRKNLDDLSGGLSTTEADSPAAVRACHDLGHPSNTTSTAQRPVTTTNHNLPAAGVPKAGEDAARKRGRQKSQRPAVAAAPHHTSHPHTSPAHSSPAQEPSSSPPESPGPSPGGDMMVSPCVGPRGAAGMQAQPPSPLDIVSPWPLRRRCTATAGGQPVSSEVIVLDMDD